MTAVYLGLGSNIDPERNLRLGVTELRERFGELTVSNAYRNAAVGFAGEDFVNVVVGVDTDVGPQAIQAQIEAIHRLAGRERGAQKFASRPLDIDLLLYGDLVVQEPSLRLPRADVLDYDFVLRPLAEMAPELRHPVTGRTMQEHWQECDTAGHPMTLVDVTL